MNIAKVIHSTQALLATGFVFSIHFFSVWLRPEKFPWTWPCSRALSAKRSCEPSVRSTTSGLREEGKLDQLRTVVPPRRAVIMALIAGYVALGIGTALLIGIVVAALTS